MPAIVVVGTQWGDEGKGKITDFLSDAADVIVRYQGGNNAGHTIQFAGETHKLHLIPSGIFFADKKSVIGNGLVINPKALLAEIEGLQKKGISTSNLRISSRAHLIFPYHILLDELEEKEKGDEKIGTTSKGIGPAYVDKAMRIGIRMSDLLEKETFAKLLQRNVQIKNKLLKKIYGEKECSFEEIFTAYYEYGQQLKKYVIDTSYYVNESLDCGKNILFEGAQGVMLDIDHGTYPFVTSSNPIAGGVGIGVGIGPSRITSVVGVCKAYTTRVGDGPFPTELHDEIGNQIREIGREYGTTTGRARRVGWLDMVVLSHAKRVSGLTHLSLNSIDVLTGLETLKICVGYELDGKQINYYPSSLEELKRCVPIYESFPGWKEDITNCKKFDELPPQAQNYVQRICELLSLPLFTFSVGPDRTQTNVVQSVWVSDEKVKM